MDKNQSATPRDGKDPNADINFEGTFLSKLSNIWYYYKWHIAVAIGIFALILLFVSQISIGERNDGTVLMGGPYLPTISEKNGMHLAFAEILPKDYNDDGDMSVEIIHYEVYSTEQFKAIPGIDKSSTANVENIKALNNLITVGDYPICIIDEWVYEDLRKAGGVRPLSELFSDTPDCAIDEYAIRFKDTEFAKTFSAFSSLPDSTVICIRTRSVFGADEKLYKNAEELFCAIVEYRPES
jgi:hypothetical protein